MAGRTACVVFLLMLISSCGNPSLPSTQTYRIGFYQGGNYHDYSLHFRALLSALESMGYIEQGLMASIEPNASTEEIWRCLSDQSESTVVFPENAFWSAEWKTEYRDSITTEIVHRTGNDGDLDLVLALGTWAGKDLSRSVSSCPVLVLSTSNPLEAGIVEHSEYSGIENIHATNDPDRYVRRLTAFHRITGFTDLALVYDNTPAGMVYSNVEDYRRVASTLGFRIHEFHLSESEMDRSQAAERLAEIYRNMPEEVDAVAFTTLECEQPKYFPVFMPVLLERKILTFGQLGDPQVRRGALVGIAEAEYSGVGEFYAETMIRVLAGEPPGSISQVFEDPLRLSINLRTAEEIGFVFPSSIINAADTVYGSIEEL